MGVSSVTSGNSNPIDFQQETGFQTLKTEDFVQLLITQLQNQNPLEPLEDNQLLQQVSSIQSLSSTNQLVDSLNAFTLNQSLGAASNLIGREVTAQIGDSSITGVVERAIVEDGKVYVLVNDQKVPFDRISSVAAGPGSSADLASILGGDQSGGPDG